MLEEIILTMDGDGNHQMSFLGRDSHQIPLPKLINPIGGKNACQI